jgi:hypothetical protein
MSKEENEDRAGRALHALQAYAKVKRCSYKDDTRTMLIDLIADLMHLAEQTGHDHEPILRVAADHYVAEASE